MSHSRAPAPLKVLRVLHGDRQIDLAARAGVSRETISRSETGTTRPRPETAAAIANAVGVSADVLFPPV